MAGLIQKYKGNRGNNVYVVYKPLNKTELYKCVPHKVDQFKEFESKLVKTAKHNKERFQQHLQDKQLRKRKQQEQQIQTRQVISTVDQLVNNESKDFSPEDIELLRKVELLGRS